VYNAEKYLKKCVESILSQSYNFFEVILIDDGSKDKSGKICDEFSMKDSRIKVIHKMNQGVSSARNDGIKKSDGDYILFVDSDDYFNDDYFFKKLVEINNDNELTLYSFTVDDLIHNKKYIAKSLDEFATKDFNRKNKNEKIKELLKKNRLFVSPWTKMISRDLIIKNNLYFDENLKTCEDIEWGIRLYSVVKDFYVSNFNSYTYIVRKESLTGTRPKGSWENRYTVIERNMKLLDSNNALKSILAIQYSLMVGDLIELEDKENTVKGAIYEKIKKLDKVLNFSMDKKSRVFRVLYKLLGLSISIKIMDSYINKKRS
ncbi:MAG: glycosyltransferase family 2 protein, partial [Psychrilyobacter sp.]|uniref:glycosyltransferase family 2 protein n=1 Tax=Psychrilyobacter sp. TaxID=2586924 RepID=UPI003C714E27